MGQHGFARDMEFTLEAQTEENISFVLTDTAETCEKYPFHFALHIGYELCKNEVKVNWTVENTDTKELYFSIGAHTAFNCPIHGEGNKTGYGLKFGGLADTIHHHGNTPDGMAVMEDKVLALNHGTEDAMPQILPAHCSSATTKTCCRRAEHSRQLIVLHICKIESAKGGS